MKRKTPAEAWEEDRLLLCGSDGVDSLWYRKTYADIGPSVDTVEHYMRFGWHEGRSPNAWFSTTWYLQNNPDVRAAGTNPLVHFLRKGRKQGRGAAPHDFFNTLAWLRGPNGVNPHWYLKTYRLPSETDAAAHYAEHGWREGKDPNAGFSTHWYLAVYPDIAAAGINPFVHYLQYGRSERRDPKPTFPEILRVSSWWMKLAPISAAIYATTFQLDVPLLSLTPLLLLAFTAVVTQAIYVSFVNDFSDRSEDLACGKRNGLVGISTSAIAAMLACCLVLGILITFYLRHNVALASSYVAGWIAFSAYSLPPFRLKVRGILGVIADAAGAHLFPTLFGVLLVYYWQAAPISPLWVSAVAVWSFCYGTRGILWHQLIDRDNDVKIGAQTFVQTHQLETVLLLAHGIFFPCEIVALGCILWITASPLAAAFLALYVGLEWRRPRVSASPLILIHGDGKMTAATEDRLALVRYYDFFLPLSLLLASALRYPTDLWVALAHVLILPPRRTWHNIAALAAPGPAAGNDRSTQTRAPAEHPEQKRAGHLIHIGYAKAGSNFLRQWMATHPQLQFAAGGIAGFNDVFQLARDSAVPRQGVLFHVTSYEGLAQPHVNAGGEHVDYDSVRSQSIARAQAQAYITLAALFPKAHVLIVTRGFRSMIQSSYSQYVRSGGYGSLRTMMRDAVEGGQEAWDYDHLIKLYAEAFGDRLIVMPYELLRDDSDAFTHELERRLGLTHHASPSESLNRGLSAAELAWYPRLSRLMRRLPIGHALRTSLYELHVHAMLTGYYRPLAALLQRLMPKPPHPDDQIDDTAVNVFRGKAECLRNNPLFDRYRADYLL